MIFKLCTLVSLSIVICFLAAVNTFAAEIDRCFKAR